MPHRHATTIAFAAAVTLSGFCTGCDKDPTPATQQIETAATAARPPPPERKSLDRPRNQKELPTTSAKIFLANLDGRIDAGKKLIEQNPEIVSRYSMTGNALMARARIFGDLEQLAEAIEMANQALKRQPKHAGSLLLRARARISLHEFEQARADAESVIELGSQPAAEHVIADYQWNVGNHEPAIKFFRAAESKRSDLYTLARIGQLEMDLGNPKAAEKTMARAELLFRDVSPVPVAWLNVQRGLIALHTGQFEKAKRFYTEAMERIPTYPMAIEHLAEIEHLLGNTDRSIELYRKVIEQTQDPEFIGALSGVLREKGERKEADELRNQAKKRIEELMKKYPNAMYWHAAGFFLEEGGDPKRALRLLEKNVELRPTYKSYVALAGAQLENGKVDEAGASIEKALATPFKTAELFWTAAKVRTAQKKSDEAKKLIEKAKKLNPKIAELEGPIEPSKKGE